MDGNLVTLDKVISLYRDIIKRSKEQGIDPRYDIRGKPSVINEIFGDAQTFMVDDYTVKVIRDDAMPEREVGEDFYSDLYIYDPVQLKRNNEESKVYGFDMLISLPYKES